MYYIIVIFIALLMARLIYALKSDPFIKRRHKRVLIVTVLLAMSLICQSLVDYQLGIGEPRIMARTAVAVYGYAVRPLLIVLFYYVIIDGQKKLGSWVLVGLNAAVYLTAFFSPAAFWISRNNHFHRGPLGYTCHIVTGLLMANLLCLVIKQYRHQQKSDMLVPIMNTAAMIASVILDDTAFGNDNFPISALNLELAASCVFFYIWLHLRFVREHEQALQAEQRIQIMRTQIQPHFLFNTIATFKALCRKNPQQAAEVAEKFGAYLRQNLDSLDAPGNIPFEKELEHTKLYSDIEMVRFDNIRVEYDVEDSCFSVPPLTLQPMVENAIRHGVRVRDRGIVRVSTRKTPAGHEIIIQDNGIGFDLQEAEAKEGQHLGIRNVRERIESMCGGTLTIESTEGEGTVVKITIPDTEGAA